MNVIFQKLHEEFQNKTFTKGTAMYQEGKDWWALAWPFKGYKNSGRRYIQAIKMNVMNSMVKTLPKMYTKKNKCPARGLDETVQTWQMVIE